uniref:CRC domain-containing protein n=1 Tax=Capitella teleta TaxID=283909 RepID=X2B1A3_CAPTE
MNSVRQTTHGGNQQVILTSQAAGTAQQQTAQTIARRTIPAGSNGPQSSQGQVVTKVIIQRQGASSGHSLLNPTVSSHAPTQTITLSEGGIVSSQKHVSTTPTKQIIPTGKLPISPLKSPTRYIVSTGTQSPPKLLTSTGQMITMITRPSNVSKTSTITVSPAGVKLKPQNSVSTIEQAQRIMGNHSTAANVQPVSIGGGKFQYVRVVSTPGSQSGAVKGIQGQQSVVPVSNAVKIAMPPHQLPNQQQQMMNRVRGATMHSSGAFGPSNPRLILPATLSQPIPIQPQPSVQNIRPQLAQSSQGAIGGGSLTPGSTINVVGSGMQSFALVPAQYVTQVQQQQQQQQHITQPNVEGPSAYAPLNTGNLNHQLAVAKISNANGAGSAAEQNAAARPRKACNCTKSQCLKLYCDCFANGEFCSNCNCVNCFNNLEHEEERSRSIKTCLERNPQAFHPKIGKSKAGQGDIRRHNKGCNCKRSGCLKNYCECYEAKILCTSLCKCVGCKNFEESPDRKTLMHLADAAEVRVQQQTAAKSKMDELPIKQVTASDGERLAHTFVTSEVVEAACACLLAQAEETERTRQMDICQERLILEEFGRCLMQVIESSNSTKGSCPHLL